MFRRFVFGLLSSFSIVCICFTHADASDILEKVIQPSKQYDQIINLGNNKTAVGNEIFREGTTISVSLADGVQATKKDPLIVRVTKWLLRITIAISISMIIYIGIRFILAGVRGADFGDLIKDMTNLIIGLILALSSVSIIRLVQSVTLSSISG